MSTFLFYDLETTGLDPVFDQILQFAAIRTDEALNPVAAPVNWFVRLRPDVIPSPGALLKTNRAVISLQDGRPEYEVLRDIWNLVNVPGTISIGHNSLDFDDKFLRFGFYRNLLPAYTHQFSDGCGRSDLLAILIRYRHFAAGRAHLARIGRRPDAEAGTPGAGEWLRRWAGARRGWPTSAHPSAWPGGCARMKRSGARRSTASRKTATGPQRIRYRR